MSARKLREPYAAEPALPEVGFPPQQAHHPATSSSAVLAARGRRRAILCVLGASACYTVAAVFVKAIGGAVPTWEVVFFRNAVAAACMVPLIRRADGWSVLRTQRPLGHAGRLLAGLAGIYGSFYGYARLPIATVTALGFSMPIFLALLSVPLLRERIGLDRGLALAAGLAGVLLVLRPWQGSGGLPLAPALVVVAGVVFWALGTVSIRRMGRAGERSITIALLFTLGSSIVSGLLCIPVWVVPSGQALAALVGVGAVSAAAQLLMTEGYRSGDAAMLAPFEYGAILYTVLLGFLVWGEAPGAWEFAGIAVLVASGLYAWWRAGQAAS